MSDAATIDVSVECYLCQRPLLEVPCPGDACRERFRGQNHRHYQCANGHTFVPIVVITKRTVKVREG